MVSFTVMKYHGQKKYFGNEELIHFTTCLSSREVRTDTWMQELMQRSGRGVSYCLVPHGVLSLFCNAILSQMFSSGITHSELCPPISIIIKKTKSLTDLPIRKCYQGIFSVNIPFPRTTLGYHVDIKTRQDKWRKHSCHCFTPLKT